jgi:hypothetical protein
MARGGLEVGGGNLVSVTSNSCRHHGIRVTNTDLMSAYNALAILFVGVRVDDFEVLDVVVRISPER